MRKYTGKRTYGKVSKRYKAAIRKGIKNKYASYKKRRS